MKLKYFLLFLVSLAILQISDYLFYISNPYAINSKFVFGVYGDNILATVIALFLLLAIYFIIPKTKIILVLFLFLLTGTVSNIIDRFVYGGVVDYIKIWFIPTFNLADIVIIASVILIFLKVLKKTSIK